MKQKIFVMVAMALLLVLSGLMPAQAVQAANTPEAAVVFVDHFATIQDVVDNVAQVTNTVTNPDDLPVAVSDTYTTTEDTLLVVVAPGVLANDSDPDGDPLTAVLVTDVASGTLTLEASGAFTYTPDVDFFGVDSFTYVANDGIGDSNVATVTITVTNTNDLPVAVSDTYTTTEETPLVVAAPGVLVNDSDPEGDPLTAVLVTDVANGTLTLEASGAFTYTPDVDFFGVDSFTYVANDGIGDSNVATVTITVPNINDLPVAVSDTYITPEDTPLVVAAPGVLVNDSDPEGDPLTAVLVTDVANGTLTLEASGAFTYTPDVDFFGVDSFTYVANDGIGDSNVATVTITVTNLPVAVSDTYTTTEETPLVVVAPGVLANDSDPEGDPLTAVLVTDVASGTLTLEASGAFTYTPDVDFFGVDFFTYVANDGIGDSNVATVTITVTNVNDPPVAVDDFFILDEDTILTVASPGILLNDSDPDGDNLVVGMLGTVHHGTLQPRPGGGFIYTPDAEYSGSDSFTYRLFDGEGFSNVATVNLTVNLVDDAPVAVGEVYTMTEDSVLTIDAPGVLDNDSDIDSEVLTATLVADVAHGTLVLNADGSFTYTPVADFFGTDTFTYVANDGTSDSNVVTVTITVTDMPDEPETQYFFLPMVYKFQP